MTDASATESAKEPGGSKEQETGERILNVPVPLVAAGVTVIGAFGVAAVIHWLSKRREAATRRAASCSRFRAAVLSAVAAIPTASEHWDNQVLSSLSAICTTIGVAVGEFRPFVTSRHLVGLDNEWGALKKHCEEQIPKALSAAELMYGGGTPIAGSAKEKFHAHVQNLLSFAKET